MCVSCYNYSALRAAGCALHNFPLNRGVGIITIITIITVIIIINSYNQPCGHPRKRWSRRARRWARRGAWCPRRRRCSETRCSCRAGGASWRPAPCTPAPAARDTPATCPSRPAAGGTGAPPVAVSSRVGAAGLRAGPRLCWPWRSPPATPNTPPSLWGRWHRRQVSQAWVLTVTITSCNTKHAAITVRQLAQACGWPWWSPPVTPNTPPSLSGRWHRRQVTQASGDTGLWLTVTITPCNIKHAAHHYQAGDTGVRWHRSVADRDDHHLQHQTRRHHCQAGDTDVRWHRPLAVSSRVGAAGPREGPRLCWPWRSPFATPNTPHMSLGFSRAALLGGYQLMCKLQLVCCFLLDKRSRHAFYFCDYTNKCRNFEIQMNGPIHTEHRFFACK